MEIAIITPTTKGLKAGERVQELRQLFSSLTNRKSTDIILCLPATLVLQHTAIAM
jgi:hypothetical protein